MQRLLLTTLLSVSLSAACGKKEPTPTPTTAPPATTAPATTAEADAGPATPAATREEWLVWAHGPLGFRTRWVSVAGDDFTLVAERKAPFLSDGTKIWRVERADQTVDVSPCVCIEEENSPDCKVIGKVTRPGLRAVELGGGAPLEIYPAGNDGMVGDSMDLAVRLTGGVGARLFFSWTEGGYFCGAHGSWEGGTRVYDLAAGDFVPDVWETLDKKLPASVRAPAVKELYEPLKGCDNEELTLDQAAEQAKLDGVYVTIDGSGKLEVTWSFSAWVVYACSSTYSVDGSSISGLLPEAADIGLTGPLAPGLAKAVGAVGPGVVGWARLTLEGDARAAALAAFEASPEPPWGAERFSEELSAAAVADNAKDAKKLVADARKLVAAKKYGEAIGTYNIAINLDPKLAKAYSGRGYAALLDGSLDAAKADFDKALELESDPEVQAQVWFNLGMVAEKKKDKAAARDAYTKSLELRPHDGVQKALDRVK